MRGVDDFLKFFLATLIVLSAFFVRPASADSGDEEAQIFCNKDGQNLTIKPLSTWESDPALSSWDPHNKLEPGFTRIDRTHSIICRLGQTKVEVSVEITPGQPGNCQGGGFSFLTRLLVNGKSLVRGQVEIDGGFFDVPQCRSQSIEFSRLRELRLQVTWPTAKLRTCQEHGPTDLPPRVSCSTSITNIAQ